MDDKPVRDAEDLLQRVGDGKPGEEADLVVERGKKTLELTVKMGKRPVEAARPDDDEGSRGRDRDGSGAPKGRLGLTIEDGDGGARVTSVERGPSREMGLRAGDLIVEADGKPVASARDLQAAVEKVRRKGKIVLLVKRDGETFYAAIRFAPDSA
jgi:serine protease Do